MPFGSDSFYQVLSRNFAENALHRRLGLRSLPNLALAEVLLESPDAHHDPHPSRAAVHHGESCGTHGFRCLKDIEAVENETTQRIAVVYHNVSWSVQIGINITIIFSLGTLSFAILLVAKNM